MSIKFLLLKIKNKVKKYIYIYPFNYFFFFFNHVKKCGMEIIYIQYIIKIQWKNQNFFIFFFFA
jgi:hypothetical protein